MAKKKIDRNKLLGIKKPIPKKKPTVETQIPNPSPVPAMPEEKLESAVEKIHQPVVPIPKKTSKPVRTSLDLPRSIHKRLKTLSVDAEISMKELILRFIDEGIERYK